MSNELVNAAVVVVLVWIAVVLLDRLSHRQAVRTNPPPQPDALRKQLEQAAVKGPVGYVLLALFFLPLVVPGVLLVALADGGMGWTLGVALLAWAVGTIALGFWRGRPERRRRDQERLLAHSEDFWSRPDAEEWAARIRTSGPFARSR